MDSDSNISASVPNSIDGDDPMNVKHIVTKLEDDDDNKEEVKEKPKDGLPKHLEEADNTTEFLLLSLQKSLKCTSVNV